MEVKGMPLSIARKVGESVRVTGEATITVSKRNNGRIVLRIDAPDDTRIIRTELVDKGVADDRKAG